MHRLLGRFLAIADEPGQDDDDDARLRRRVGVIAGVLTIFAPLTLPVQTQGHPLSFVLAAGMSGFSLLNLAVLAQTHRYERYVTALLVSGMVFVPAATWLGGGLLGTSSGLVFAFLMPAYAIMALGPRRASWWFAAFLGVAIVMVAVDPIVNEAAGPKPYAFQLIGTAMNAVMPLVIVFLLLRYTDVRRRAAEARVDELLTNAIPRSIATRLRRGESRIAESYPEATVLFADIAGFTPWAQRTEPERVVTLLDDLFSRLDALAATHGVEKIKTIGDAYMAAVGVPEPRDDHAEAGLRFGEAIVVAGRVWCAEHDLTLDLRVGVASGAVVGGVIGRQRILFDLWGDTVNLASRLEAFGLPDRVQVAESTWRRLADQSGFERREIEVKGLGTVSAYVRGEAMSGSER